MDMAALEYRITSSKDFDTLVQDLQTTAQKHGFRTLHVHNVQATLAERGFSLGPYSIIEVCNASYAHSVLTREKAVGMMLPCPIVVYDEDGARVISLMRPTAMSVMMPTVDLGSIPADVESILRTIVDEAAA